MKLVRLALVTLAVWAALCAALLAPRPACGQAAAAPDVDRIVRELDQLFRSASSRGSLEMRIVTPDWERTLEMDMWTEGTDRTFIRINAPRKERGVGTLRIGKEMWNFLPNVNKVIKVPPSMMTSAWMGSDFTNDDVVSEISFVDDYDHELASVEAPEQGLIYIRSVPHDGVPVVWAQVVSAVREDGYLPVWERYYDEKGRLMRSMLFSEPRTFGARTIPAVLELVPENEKGRKTVMRYTDIVFDVPVDEEIFTLRHLRSPR